MSDETEDYEASFWTDAGACGVLARALREVEEVEAVANEQFGGLAWHDEQRRDRAVRRVKHALRHLADPEVSR